MKIVKPATVVTAVGLAVLVAAVPLRWDWSSSAHLFAAQQADAKNGNNGGGRGKGGGGGGGDKGDRGGPGDRGGKGRDGASGKTKGRAASVVDKKVTPDSVRVRYRNGYGEQVVRGRFIMKDAKGRTIVNRKATPSDRLRLWFKSIAP